MNEYISRELDNVNGKLGNLDSNLIVVYDYGNDEYELVESNQRKVGRIQGNELVIEELTLIDGDEMKLIYDFIKYLKVCE